MTTTTWDLREHTAETLWTLCCSSLDAAVQSAKHPFHFLTVASLADAQTPTSRTVVLRNFDANLAEITFHTDSRSPKVSQLRRHPVVHLLWYAPVLRLQIRATATAVLHHQDDRARAAWDQARCTSRACYSTVSPPGDPVAGFSKAPAIPQADDDRGLIHFAVVACRFRQLEVLALHASGHQRVRLAVPARPITWELLAP